MPQLPWSACLRWLPFAPAILASTAAVRTPAVVNVAAQPVAPASIASTVNVRQPIVTRGAVTIAASRIVSASAVRAPVVTRGSVGLAPAHIASTASVKVPVVTRGSVTITPARIASQAVVRMPAITILAPAAAVSSVFANKGANTGNTDHVSFANVPLPAGFLVFGVYTSNEVINSLTVSGTAAALIDVVKTFADNEYGGHYALFKINLASALPAATINLTYPYQYGAANVEMQAVSVVTGSTGPLGTSKLSETITATRMCFRLLSTERRQRDCVRPRSDRRDVRMRQRHYGCFGQLGSGQPS